MLEEGGNNFNFFIMQEEFHEEESDMTLSEKMAEEERVVDEAFNNSYLIITKRKRFEDLIELGPEIKKGKKMAITAHNPEDDVDDETLENMIYYFEDLEEYEKCAELKKILDNV